MRNKTRNTLLTLGILACCVSSFSFATEAHYATCITCHGANGEGNPAMKAPALAGMSANYLERQIRNFRDGKRGADPSDTWGGQMRAMSAVIGSDENVKAVSTYLAGLPKTPNTTTIEGDIGAGEKLYHGNCGACHGPNGQGNEAFNAPSLTNQDGEYLLRQMQNFVSGSRGAHPDDTYGAQMAMMAKVVNDEQKFKDVISYLQSLSK